MKLNSQPKETEMASSPSNQPARSISLPSRPHPIVPQIQDYLCSLRSCSESTSNSLGHKLSNLKHVLDCLNDLLLLPHNQSKLTQNARWVDELLDGSLRLLDVCAIASDVLSQSKEHIKEIQSSLRRRSNGELIVGDEVLGYVSMRKKTKAMIKACFKDVRTLVKRFGVGGGDGKEDGNVFDVMREVEGVTAQVFEALLGLLSGSKPQSFKKNATLPFVMCRIMMYQSWALEKGEAASFNEFEEVDESVSALMVAQKKKTRVDVADAENLRTKMLTLDSSIQDLDEALEGLFRCLVKTRATLLNVLSH